MTSSNSIPIIDSTTEHYRNHVAKVKQNQQRIEELQYLTETLLNSSTGHNLAEPACYHRQHAPTTC